MIYIKDNFLDKELFDFVNKDLKQFKEVHKPLEKRNTSMTALQTAMA